MSAVAIVPRFPPIHHAVSCGWAGRSVYLAAGVGLPLLPVLAVSRELRQQQLKALAWDGPLLDIATHLVWHRGKWVSPAMSAFVDLVKKTGIWRYNPACIEYQRITRQAVSLKPDESIYKPRIPIHQTTSAHGGHGSAANAARQAA